MTKFFHHLKYNFFSRLDFYFYKELAPNYIFGIFFFTFILLLNELFFLLKYYIEYNVPLNQVMLMLGNLMPFLLSYSLPFASLPAYLLTMGRFSQDSEIVAMKSCGISTLRIVRSGILLGFFLGVFAFLFNNLVVVPANYNYIRLRAKVMSQKPAVEVKERSFMSLGGFRITFDKMENVDHTDVLDHVHVVDIKGRRTVKAEKGRIFSDPENPEHYVLKLQKGSISEVIKDSDEKGQEREHFFVSYFRYLAMNASVSLPSDVYNKGPDTMNILELIKSVSNHIAPTKRQMSLTKQSIVKLTKEYKTNRKKLSVKPKESELKQFVNNAIRIKARNKQILIDLKQQTSNLKKLKRSLPRHEIMKIHEKIALPFASFFFALISLSIGMFSARSGRGEGLGLSVLIMLAYYGLKVGTENLILKGILPPVAEWLGSLLFFLIGSVMLWKKVRE